MADVQLKWFLLDAARRPFAWGRNDCLMWLADWIVARRGVDPGEGWRGTYRTALGAERIVRRAGGVVAHMDACLGAVGVARVEAATLGDVVAAQSSEGIVGGIVVSAGIAQLAGDCGLIVRRQLPVLAAWRV